MDIGKKIKEMRIALNLTQEELADRVGLSKGFISQMEHNSTSPSISTLEDILTCLGVSLADFFAEKEEQQIVFKKEDHFKKEDCELKNIVRWVVPTAQKCMMEPVCLVLEPGGSTQKDLPHEGEEFGYVIKGKVNVHYGGWESKWRETAVQKKALMDLIKKDGSLSYSQMAAELGLNSKIIRSRLKRLIANHYVERTDTGELRILKEWDY